MSIFADLGDNSLLGCIAVVVALRQKSWEIMSQKVSLRKCF